MSVKDFSREKFIYLFEKANDIRENLLPGEHRLSEKYRHELKGRLMATLFWEPSTRTRMSFEAAMMHQGGRILGGFTAEGSSSAKGETIADTIRNICGYDVSVIVMRHKLEGAAREAAEYADEYGIPIINGGDGSHEHPTQTLLDLYTMYRAHGDISGKNIVLVGDLKYGRTPHSLIHGLGVFGAKITLVAPEELKMPEQYISDFRKTFGTEINQTSDMSKIIESSDVLYMTRIQKERFSSLEEYQKVSRIYELTGKIASKMKEDAIIMHPLPRTTEISLDVDTMKRAYYFEQSKNGWLVRAALLHHLLKGD